MIKEVEIVLFPSEVEDESLIFEIIRKKLKLGRSSTLKLKLLKKSLDSRKRPVFRLRFEAYINQSMEPATRVLDGLGKVPLGKKVIIVGAGPAGYFCGLKLLELGIKPIILDRGKSVRERRKDLKAIQQDGVVNPDSNYCYGEGGAGTYSDGKLYTRSHKRGKVEEILQIFVELGARRDILWDAHPHIGSNKLPRIIDSLRQEIESKGGEVVFGARVTDLIVENMKVVGVVTNDKEWMGDAVVLATGHSARDIYEMCQRKGVQLSPKPFAMGVRVEHSQELIDDIQYGQKPREAALPAASYSMTCRVEDKGVFSFCMCPGGLIVPSSTSPGEIVVNGMSLSKRDSSFANSGLVTEIGEQELKNNGFTGLMAGANFQQSVEQAMWKSGDGSQKAPAQRMIDFVKGRISNDLPDSSYIPGIYPATMQDLLPTFIVDRLKKSLTVFDKKLKGYYTNEAILVGSESRTSAPVRMDREKDNLMSCSHEALFPCGEGAGYAGGILSAAMDGQNVAKAIHEFLV